MEEAGHHRNSDGDGDLLAGCGIDDLDELSGRCVAARIALGLPTTRWAAPCIAVAVKLAVITRSWPADRVVPALLAVAADPATRSPVRVAEAGPWWDHTNNTTAGTADRDTEDLQALEERLAELGGHRPLLQARARAELAAENIPVTRTTVTRRAIAMLDRFDDCPPERA